MVLLLMEENLKRLLLLYFNIILFNNFIIKILINFISWHQELHSNLKFLFIMGGGLEEEKPILV